MKFSRDFLGGFRANTANLGPFDLCLEIGCFEGKTSTYIVKNLLTDSGKLVCVDPLLDRYPTWPASEQRAYFNGQYDRFINNVKDLLEANKIELVRQTSAEAFPALLDKYEEQVEFIYIDGDHRAGAVYLDAVNCFKLCKSGGYILFDDYRRGSGKNATRAGIDKFLLEYVGDFWEWYKKVSINYQVLIQKV